MHFGLGCLVDARDVVDTPVSKCGVGVAVLDRENFPGLDEIASKSGNVRYGVENMEQLF